jgi:peptidoglycan/xylan/chitin deacetylase (PgdA/CDA1 family)
MRQVTLSFDNGPDPEVTPRVLDVLEKYDLRSCFFVIGRKLADPAARKIAERAHAEGHWIGNHTWTHETPLGRLDDPSVPDREIGATQREIGELTHPDRWFRPFGGGGKIGPWLMSAGARDFLTESGYSVVIWNSIPRDWDDHDGWPGRAMAHCAAQDHTLVVLHDFVAPAMANLDRFIGTLADQGFTFSQEFPDDCILIRRGIATRPLDNYVQS